MRQTRQENMVSIISKQSCTQGTEYWQAMLFPQMKTCIAVKTLTQYGTSCNVTEHSPPVPRTFNSSKSFMETFAWSIMLTTQITSNSIKSTINQWMFKNTTFFSSLLSGTCI